MKLNPTEVTQQLEAAITALETEIDPTLREEERARVMHDFEAPDGKWKYAPKDEKQRAAKALREDQDHRAGERLYDVGRMVIDIEPLLKQAVESAKEPPSPLESFTRSNNTNGKYTLEQELLVDIREELQQQTLDHQYGSALPSVVLAAYKSAVELGDDATIRYTEKRHGRGWAGRDLQGADQITQATAAQSLGRYIRQQRDSRIHPEYKAALEAFARARKAMQKAADLHGIVPRNPDHYPAPVGA